MTKSFTIEYPNIVQMLVSQIGITTPFENEHLHKKSHGIRNYVALWDTGATSSVITSKIAEECELTTCGFVNIGTANGVCVVPTYFISVWLPNRVCINPIKVCQGKLSGEIDVLIGMDVMHRGDLAINHFQGKTSFSFRMPSLHKIDYVKLTQDNPEKTIGRNKNCPCGSGKKYKHCHGKAES